MEYVHVLEKMYEMFKRDILALFQKIAGHRYNQQTMEGNNELLVEGRGNEAQGL
jgi:hypothetical protein